RFLHMMRIGNVTSTKDIDESLYLYHSKPGMREGVGKITEQSMADRVTTEAVALLAEIEATNVTIIAVSICDEGWNDDSGATTILYLHHNLCTSDRKYCNNDERCSDLHPFPNLPIFKMITTRKGFYFQYATFMFQFQVYLLMNKEAKGYRHKGAKIAAK
ncbi:hypothetical protein ACJX0J_039803, partial [Zea mays]